MTTRTRITGNLYNPIVPEGAIDISRRGKWGNPHPVARPCHRCNVTHERLDAIYHFVEDLYTGQLGFTVEDVRRELTGRTLACWCRAEDSCHGDVLIAAIESSDAPHPAGR